MDASEPAVPLLRADGHGPEGRWHLPLVDPERDLALSLDAKIKVSVARCARVSYLTHDGVRDPEKDFELYDRLLSSGHMSPFEHAAMADESLDEIEVREEGALFYGNFRGWVQHRKMIPGESVFGGT